MGSKQTKVITPETPSTSVPITNMSTNVDISSLDPRSPAESRTPICLPEREANNHKSLDALRKRFLKSFAHTLYDPRSPSLNFNRTPLVLEDTLEKSLSLDDTFSDLFVESRLAEAVDSKQSEENVDKEYEQYKDNTKENLDIDTQESTAVPKTPVVQQQEIDPRSPSAGVERTPIIFSDEVDNTDEDVMLENILATLSLNLNTSDNSSVVSIASQNVNVKINSTFVHKPLNKHLDRVRAGKKISAKEKLRKAKLRESYHHIYEDQENYMLMTPKSKGIESDKADSMKGKRIPLICVLNRNSTHSPSAASSPISAKTRLPLTLYPIENTKLPNKATINGLLNTLEQ